MGPPVRGRPELPRLRPSPHLVLPGKRRIPRDPVRSRGSSSHPELGKEIPPGLQLLIDRAGALGSTFGVNRAPTLILLVEGNPVGRLDWPFTEENVMRELTRSLEFRPLTSRDLLGAPAPDILALSLSGEPVVLADLSRPLLLVFFNPGCPPCWDALPALAEISRDVAVGVLAFVGEPRLSPADRSRLAGFVQAADGYPRFVLLVQDLEVLRTYRVMGMPSYILLDEKGVIT
mgnify:CR=1 FL=1